MTSKKYYFDDAADRLIRDQYDSRTETIDRLSCELRLPRRIIKRRAQVLGVARTKEGLWSEEEVNYLEANLHRLSVAVLARHLGRSATAVAVKAKRLGIKKSGEGYTASTLAEAFGVESHRVVRWIDLGLLKASKRNSERERDMYYISDQAVKKFICTYPTIFNIKKVDQLWFIDLLAGVRRGDGD